MRLIDADKLAITPIDVTDLPQDRCLRVVLWEDVEKAETVDAIPIEWIEDIYIKYMKTLKDSDNNPKSKKWFELRILAYKMLIRDWRKENER